MEVVMLTQNINSLFSGIGSVVGHGYEVAEGCQDTLKEILRRLYNEDKYVRSFRRLIANSQIIKIDLLPLFCTVKEDKEKLDLLTEIFENLMTPVECLLPIDLIIKEDAGRNTICQLNWLLTACKEAFVSASATECVTGYLSQIINYKEQQPTAEHIRSINLCLLLLRNLLHIPEVRGGAPGGGTSHQSKIIWNLFHEHIDELLIELMTGSSRALWSPIMVQLISLLYKDQHSNTICKLLNTWCDNNLSESSEDDESNTSPQDRGSGYSSSMVTSDPTSDSSDSDHQKNRINSETENTHQSHPKQATQTRMTEILANGVGRKAQVAMRNKHGVSSKNTHPSKHRQAEHFHSQDVHSANKVVKIFCSSDSGLGSTDSGSASVGGGSLKMECGCSDFSECGCNTQIQETVSTSSNEDQESSRFGKKKPVHQKPLHMIKKSRYSNGKCPLTSQARTKLRRKKLVKRSKTTPMSIKSLVNYTPTEEDISNLLTEFTVDFLLKGYGCLISELKLVVLTNKDIQLDTSHFTWLIMFFLRFATQLKVDLELISPVLSYDLIAYLTYEGVNLCEELEVTKLQVGESLSRTLRKHFLIVASLKEIIVTIESYKKMSHLSLEDRVYITNLEEKMSSTNNLKYLFILLLRHFDPSVQSHQFLQDLVVANHHLLLLMENCSTTSKAAITDHIKQFATEDVMKQYGILLACFEDNGEAVNNCIFTMMHHVAGDLDRVSVLYQPSILRSFTRIVETDFQIRDDWLDLVEYVIQKCLKTKQIKVATATSLNFGDDKLKSTEFHAKEMTPVDEKLLAVEEQNDSEWCQEDLDNLSWYFPQSMEMEDLVGHISQLFLDNCGQNKNRIQIIENLFKQDLIQEEQYKYLMGREPSSNKPEKIQNNNNTEMDILEGIKVIIDYLYTENCGFFVKWLQSCLLEACYARLVLDGQCESQFDLVEPVAYFYTMLHQPVPLVTWTQDLWRVMQLEPSIWLLSALNFHLPTRVGQAKIFARTPAEWSADHLYIAALVLGPLDSSNMKFDPSNLHVAKHSNQFSNSMDHPTSTNNCSENSLFGFFNSSLLSADWIQTVKQLQHVSKVQPLSSMSSDWLQTVKQLQTVSTVQPLEDKHEHMSIISGDEPDWDLTSMCVSDEGARHDHETITIQHQNFNI